MFVLKPTIRKTVFGFIAFTWLPAGIIFISFIRFGLSVFQYAGGQGQGMMMFFSCLSGLFLAFACRKLWLQERKVPMYTCAILLGPTSVLGVLMAGLLGPLMMLLYAAIISSPAWLLVFIFHMLKRRQIEDG